jgi:hypothetical protein
MMWLARYCENMTKKAIAKEKEEVTSIPEDVHFV